MKRITALLLAFVFVLGSIGAARADGINVKVKGTWDFAFGWVNNKGFTDNVNNSAYDSRGGRYRDDDNFEARQRVRTQINFITSEYLQGVLMFEIGDMDWGRPGKGRHQGAALDGDAVNVETKRAYLDWIIPETEISIRMGLQGLKLPSTRMGSPVFDADVAGIVVSSPITDYLAATAFWIRPFDQYRNDRDFGRGRYSDAFDAFGLVLPVTMDGWDFNPYFMYGFVGANSGLYDYLFEGSYNNTVDSRNSSAKAWWLGMNFNLDMFDPLTFSVDAVYGHLQSNNLRGFGNSPATWQSDGSPTGGEWSGGSDGLQGDTWYGAEGWYIGATLDYKLDFMTPGIFGWYASGDDDNDYFEDRKLGRLPVVGTDGGFQATTFGQAGYYSIGNGGGQIGAVTNTATGTWGIGVQLADITFIEDLSHTLRFAYYRGTNDSDLVRRLGGNAPMKYATDYLYLTDEDCVFEVNFDHQYKIYENLTAVLELGYLHLRSDRDTWNGGRNRDESDDAFKGQVMFRYSF